MLNAIIWSLALIIFAVYSLTISPSIAGGDSGEIVAEGCHLGTAHPPGYPLMTVLVYGITKVPSALLDAIVDLLRSCTGSPVVRDTVALRVNMFCAGCTSLAAVYMGYIIHALTPNREGIKSLPGVVIGMFMFSFSPLIWQYAITAEVFPLNTFLAAYILWLVVDFSRNRKISTAIYGAFICGLALCNQHTIILYEAPLVLWMMFLLRREIMASYMLLLKLSLAFIIGVLPYLYLPIAAMISPKAGSWGHVTTFQGFLHHFLRKDYGTFQLFSGNGGKQTEGLVDRTEAYLSDANNVQGLYFAVYFAIAGVIMCIYWIMTNDKYLAQPHIEPVENISTSAAPPMTVPALNTEKGKKKTSISSHKTAIVASKPSTTLATGDDRISESECRFTGLVLVVTQIFYFAVFHSLSNLPLSDKLLYGVHQRFWMQPNVLLFILVGLGLNFMIVCVQWFQSKSINANNFSESKDKNRSHTSINKHALKKLAQTPIENASNLDEDTSGGFSSSLGPNIVSLICLTFALFASHQQLNRWYEFSNQSQVDYFKQYAQAILTPLPMNAVLIVNYDQQWTSIRYLQICEEYRPDITTLQLSMMTYKWFQYKHDLYQHNQSSTSRHTLKFPGTYSTFPNSPAISRDNAFTLLQFLDANYENYEIFLGGKVTHPDDNMAAKYDMVPVGLVSKFVQMTHVPNGTVYSKIAHDSWSMVRSNLPVLPNNKKYPEETWEWTIGRDFKDRLMGKYYLIPILFSIPFINILRNQILLLMFLLPPFNLPIKMVSH